ncbi:MAG: immunoglobulin domain-containing protein [Opitutaceae bacterium]|nr:immunoglobulin domain-containing protein [Opitutaceae bacterium]
MNLRSPWVRILAIVVAIVGAWTITKHWSEVRTNPISPATLGDRDADRHSDGADLRNVTSSSKPGVLNAPTQAIDSPRSAVVSKRFPHGQVRDERLESLGPGRERWSQWIQTDGPFPNVRADLVYETKGGVVSLVEETYYLADSVIVERPSGVSLEQFAQRLNALGLKPAAQYAFSPAVRVMVPEPLHLDSVPEALLRVATGEPGWKALPDHVAFSDARPSDYDPRMLWGLERVAAPSAWEVTTGSNNVIVAIIDSGITLNHPDLAANIWQNPAESGNGLDDDANGLVDDLHGWDFANNDNDPTDQDSHGTHVAGIIGAVGNNAIGVTGVAQRVKIIGLRAGNNTLSTSAIIQALDYLTNLKLRGVPIVVVNNSYTSSFPNTMQRESIVRARDADILFVAAAGNDGRDIDNTGLLYPVGFGLSNIIGVASTSLSDTLSDFSNWGLSSVHLGAPGTGILSTVLNNLYGVKEGTSMAAPMVAGAAALLRSAEPSLGATQLKARLISSAKALPGLANRVVSGGRLDLQALINPGVSLPVITAPQPTAELYAVESPSQSVMLAARGAGVHNGEEQGEIPVVWTKVSGPGNVAFSTLTNNRVAALFSQAGLYRVAATATSGGMEARLYRNILVGASSSVSSTQLMAQWRFDEASGAPQDSSGQGRHGTMLDGPTRDSGPNGDSALRFNGTVSTMKFAAPGPNQVTLAGWVRMDGRGNSIFPRLIHFPAYYLFAGMDTSPNADPNIGTVKFLANWSGTDGVWYSPRNLVAEGAWYHMAATYDGTKGARELPRLYLNGKELDVAAQAGAEGVIDLATGDGFLGNNEERTRALQGRLADVRIYGRQLGGEEIAVLAKAGTVESLRKWEIYVKSASATQSVVGLRMADGRLPSSSLSAVWQQISGPGSPSIVSSNGTEATLEFTQAGSHAVTVDLFENGAMAHREISIILPGSVANPVAPGFARPPANRIAAVGASITLDSEATGTPPLSFQWFHDGVPVNGQILSQLTLTSLKLADSGNYTVRVTNVAGSATSAPSQVTVLAPPSIVTHPANKLVAAGSTVELSVVANGSPPLTFQWFKDGVPLVGSTASTLVLANITIAQDGKYTVAVSNVVGSATSNEADVEVLQAPSIVSQSTSQTVLAGRTITLDVQVTGSVPYSFAWYKDGVLLPNETQPSLRFTIIRIEDSGTYTFKVSNAVGSATTTPIVLRVVSAPVITRQPATVAVLAGGRATFTVEATGTQPFTYQWQKDYGNIPGATTSQWVIPAVGQQDVGTYTVVITNEVGSVRSQEAYLAIVPAPRVTLQPQSVTVAQGSPATLEVTSPDEPSTLSYRWWRNGELVTGANSAKLDLPAVQPGQVGIYQVELTNGGGSTFSLPAIVAMTISAKTAGAVSTRPEWQNIVHPNGNIYDQHVMSGDVGSITADAGQISRISFVDPQGDIVQVEMSGQGTLTLALANASGPAEAAMYNQPGVTYMKGQATLVLANSNEMTYVAAFSVGSATNPAVIKQGVTYEGWATLRALAVRSGDNRIGGIRFGNGRFESTTGVTGLWAPGVASPTVFLSDIAAFSAALPVLAVSNTTEVGITGGGLFQPNQKPVLAEGISGLRLRAGMSSSGQIAGPSLLLGRIFRDGVDVTNTIVLPTQ